MNYEIKEKLKLLDKNELLMLKQILTKRYSLEELLDKKPDYSILKKINCGIAANGELFYNGKQSIFAILAENLANERKNSKNIMLTSKKLLIDEKDDSEKSKLKLIISKNNIKQLAAKISNNSLYGAIGNQYFRYYDVRQAEAITLSGQMAIRWIQVAMNKFLNKLAKTENIDYVIASDTDSVYLNMEVFVNQAFSDQTDKNKIINFLDKICKDILTPFIDKKYDEMAKYMNAYQQKMEMKREVIADVGIWVAKKKYCLNVYDSEGVRLIKPELKIMGIEVQRSSTPSFCRDKLKKAIRIILEGNQAELQTYVETVRVDFFKCSPEQIAFPRGVNDLKKYTNSSQVYSKGTPIHVKGALLYNDYISKNGLDKKYAPIQDGDKIKFLYLKEPNILKNKVISFLGEIPKEMDIKNYIDYKTQFEKSFVEPLKNIIESIGWEHKKQSTLEDMFI